VLESGDQAAGFILLLESGDRAVGYMLLLESGNRAASVMMGGNRTAGFITQRSSKWKRVESEKSSGRNQFARLLLQSRFAEDSDNRDYLPSAPLLI